MYSIFVTNIFARRCLLNKYAKNSNEDVPFIPLSASHLPRTCPIDFRAASAFTSGTEPAKYKGRGRGCKGRDRFVSWNGSVDAGCSTAHNKWENLSLSLFFPGKESRLPRIPARSSTQYNEKHAHYYFIIALAHMHRNACSLLHYRGSVSDTCELLRLVTGTRFSDILLQPTRTQSDEIQNRR